MLYCEYGIFKLRQIFNKHELSTFKRLNIAIALFIFFIAFGIVASQISIAKNIGFKAKSQTVWIEISVWVSAALVVIIPS